MQSDDLISRLKRLLGQREKEIEFARFRDGMNNFEIDYPVGWRYDRDIAVVDGKYTISFQSRDNLSQFTIYVDAMLSPGFKFAAYAKNELKGETSGIIAEVKKSVFNTMQAYTREYRYRSGRLDFFGGGVMFFTGDMVFSLSWSAPGKSMEKFMPVFKHMLKSLSVRKGYVIRKLGGIEDT